MLNVSSALTADCFVVLFIKNGKIEHQDLGNRLACYK